MDADKKCKRRAPVTSAPPASMRVRSSGRVAWCSRVSIWCPVSNTCTEGALVEKQATEPRTSSGSPIYGRFGALGVFFFAPALLRSRNPGRSCCRSTLSHLGEDRTEQSPTQPRTTQNGPSARTVWQTPLLGLHITLGGGFNTSQISQKPLGNHENPRFFIDFH